MAHVNSRVRKHRETLRQTGFRSVQFWAPDTRRPHFAEECRHQSCLVTTADKTDTDMPRIMDEALAGLDGWTQ